MSVLQAEKRNPGKAEKLRRQGILPMALVERSHTTTLLQTTEADLKKAMAAADGLGRLDLEIAGEKGQRKVIVKNIEKDFVKHQILTVTLQEVSAEDVVKMDLLVVGINAPAGEGDVVLTSPTDHIKVRGKMNVMPERIEVDLSTLEVGHHINAGDVKLPEGVELMSSADATLFSLAHLKAVSLEPEAEEAAEGAEAAPGSETEAASDES